HTGASAPAPPALSQGGLRPVPVQKVSRSEGEPEGRRHTVQEGDTLYGLAMRYYSDGAKFVNIYRANRDVLKAPDRLEAGAGLIIPAVPGTTELASDGTDAR